MLDCPSARIDDELVEASIFPEVIETDRLRIQRMDAAYSPREVFAVLRERDELDPVFRYLRGWDKQETLGDTRAYLQKWCDLWRDGEMAGYFMERQQDGEIVGGAWFIPDWDFRKVSIGAWLLPEYWGCGYSAERACAFIEMAFELYAFDVLEIRTTPENVAAQHSIESYLSVYCVDSSPDGLIHNDDVNHYGDVLDSLVYSVTREDYSQHVSP